MFLYRQIGGCVSRLSALLVGSNLLLSSVCPCFFLLLCVLSLALCDFKQQRWQGHRRQQIRGALTFYLQLYIEAD